MTNREKRKFKTKIKRNTLMVCFCLMNLATLFICVWIYTWAGGFCILYPFIYLAIVLHLAKKKGLMRNIRTEKQLKFNKEHTYIETRCGYHEEIEYYKNNETGEIVEVAY